MPISKPKIAIKTVFPKPLRTLSYPLFVTNELTNASHLASQFMLTIYLFINFSRTRRCGRRKFVYLF